MRLKSILMLSLLTLICRMSCTAQSWQSLWKGYTAAFMDNQVRVIDHSRGDCTTSEGQAYGMFFALVANDRARFDSLLHWTEQNMAEGDLATHLPAWMWGRAANNQWRALDTNSASDADIWMAYTLLEAGKAWKEPRYTTLGLGMARQIAAKEIVEVPGFGAMLAPGSQGFQHGSTYRFNASYVPLQLILGLSRFAPREPWKQVAANIPVLIKDSSPHGFASDWTNIKTDSKPQVSPEVGSYDAIRVYLWAGMLDKSTPHRNELLDSIAGMRTYLQHNSIPPEKVRPDGSIEAPKGPVGFSAALVPYAMALEDNKLRDQLMSRVQSEFKPQTGLIGTPPLYYDQNLALFGLGFEQGEFSFDSEGALQLRWKRD
ncbi:MAG: cellulose synthase complex periplasmic endoglucanase BcsZ [Acidobacteriaceae bacterium]